MATDYYPRIESDQKFQQLEKKINDIQFEGAKTYDTLADAVAVDPKPADGTAFKVSKVTDAANAGNYTFQSNEANGVRFESDFGLTEADKSETGPVENGTKVITEGQLYDVKQATDQKFKQLDVTTQVKPDSDNSEYKIFSFGSSGGYSRINSWYYGKSTKPIKKIGVFVCRATRLAASTAGLRVQLVIKKASGGSESRVLDYTIPQAEIDENYTFETEPSDKSVCERIIDLDTPITLEDGDQLFCNQSSPDRYLAVYYDGDNLANESGEWNNGAGNYARQWYGSYVNANYTTVPGAPSEPNSNVLHFYDAQESEISLPDLKKKIDEGIPAQSDISTVTVLPSKIYGFNFNENTINWLFRLPVEGVFKQALKSARINDAASPIIDVQSSSNGTTNISVRLSAYGFATNEYQVPYVHSSLTKLQNQSIFHQKIADSLGDGPEAGSTSEKIGPASIIDFVSQAYNEDIGNIKITCVGTKFNPANLTKFGKTFTVRGCDEARGGWAISDYIRKIFNTRRRYGSNSATRVVGKVAWDSLGLGTQTRNGTPGRSYVGFSDTSATGDLMRLTCHGYYEADPTPELWDWIVNTNGVSSFTFDGTTYNFGGSYSTADDAAQKAYILMRCKENVTNPYYDYDTVQSSDGAYAFNYTAYLNKYKTLAADGVTRLVVGSTAGTEVTDVNAWDLREPTHVTIAMCENDINNVSNGALAIDDYMLMGQRIHAHNPAIKISMATNRGYGVFNSGLYSHIGYVKEIGVDNYRLAAYEALKAELESNSDFDEIPLYAFQSPLGISGKKAIDTFNVNELDRFNGDGLHAESVWGYLDRSIATMAWIASTL
ncbi:hypothetical protein [Leeuwenhoekiella sp. ZYFB001]|uniref:hypothetical protein n=1 Tax=Leeuwenhoekiella sp. ZYFB001 TaxID=2719912 RepID=UPI0014319631|nr:hypothetical protein [Leeuwenhoekiella sp. ZYFB001]